MKMNKWLYMIAVMSVATVANADYRLELGGAFISLDSEASEAELRLVTSEIYLDAVEVKDAPIREAGFLSKKSKLLVSFSDTSVEDDDFDAFDADADSYAIGVNHISSVAHYIWGATFTSSDESDVSSDIETDILSLSFGKYLTDSSSLTLEISRVDQEGELAFSFGTFEASRDFTIYALNYRNVATLNGGSHFVFEGTLARSNGDDIDGSTDIDIGFTFYPTAQLGLGLVWSRQDEVDIDTLLISAEYFITQSIAVSAVYADISGDNGADADSFGVGIATRF